jgi:hypothetical protein
VAQARNFLAVAAQEVDRLEIVASQAFCQLTALAGMLARLEKLAGAPQPESGEAAALDVDMVCREAEGLIRYLNSCARQARPSLPMSFSPCGVRMIHVPFVTSTAGRKPKSIARVGPQHRSKLATRSGARMALA